MKKQTDQTTNLPSFEPLEDRQLCSTTSKSTAVQSITERLRSEGVAAGVTQAVIDAAINTASSGKSGDQAQAERIIVAAGLGLPADALKTNLSAKQLVEQTANLGLIGSGAKAATAEYWNLVKTKGADAALAGEVRANLAIPEASTKGKTAKQLLSDAANISLLTGDPSSPKAWAGLSLLKQGKISVEQFASQYANGGDLSVEAKALATKLRASARVHATVTRVNTKQSTTSRSYNGYNAATDVATDKDYGKSGIPYAQPSATTDQAPAGTGTDGTTAEYTINSISHNENGTTTVTWSMTVNGQTSDYTTTYYPADAGGPAFYNVTDSSGAFITGGEGTPTKDSAVGQTTQSTSDDADQAIFPADGSGDGDTSSGNNNNGNGSNGSNNGDSSDGDKKDDKSGDETSTTPAAAAPADSAPSDSSTPPPSSSSTPNPDADTTNAQARQEWLSATPFGQAEMKSILDVLGIMRGGDGDPTDPGVNKSARAAFYASAFFAKNPMTIDNSPGNVDYVDTVTQSITIDARQLQAIAIKSGGAVGGPDAGKNPTPPPQSNPVIPTAPPATTGGSVKNVFSTTAVTVSNIAVNVSTSVIGAKVAAVVAKK